MSSFTHASTRDFQPGTDVEQRSGGPIHRLARALDRLALRALTARASHAPVEFVFEWSPERLTPAGSPVGTIVVRDRATLLRLVWNPDIGFGEAYMNGGVSVGGDLVALLSTVYSALGRERRANRSSRLSWRERHTEARSRHNVHHHYDLGNEFYRLWLDRELVYTCAYFPTEASTLEEAQVAKMDRVCRKLDLKAGERVVEAGCGWGALALHMARHYGVTVRAFNLSREQIEYARHRARRDGLDGRVEFVEDDYRNVSGAYDAFVSVGMLEHVGRENYQTLGRVIDRSLGPSGRGLLHFIGRDRPRPLSAWIRRRIFPGAYPPTLEEVGARVLAPVDLTIVDVENLRPHYARTLRHWRERFEASMDRVRATFDEQFARAWQLYLAGSEAAFLTGWMQLFQVTFARAGRNDVRWQRIA